MTATGLVVPLTKGKIAFVDEEDYERVMQLNWCATYITKTWYALADIGRTKIYLHRFVMYFGSDDPQLDHADRDGLNCRKKNLRPATPGQNRHNKIYVNKTGFRGVTRDHDCFHARLRWEKKHVWLGSYPTKEEAARAYDEGAKRYYGEFAVLNFLDA